MPNKKTPHSDALHKLSNSLTTIGVFFDEILARGQKPEEVMDFIERNRGKYSKAMSDTKRCVSKLKKCAQ